MDINRSEPVMPVADREPNKDRKRRSDDALNEHVAESEGAHQEQWSDADAVDLESALSKAMSPDVQAALEALASRLEPMREDLERAKAREHDLRRQLEQHPYLPVLNRSGLEHEISRITARLARGGGMVEGGPLFICISIRTAPEIRRQQGRAAYDQAMRGACDILKRLFSELDLIGCLGGDDLGVVMIDSDGEAMAATNAVVARVYRAFAESPIDAGSAQVRLQIDVGACSLLDHTSFASAMAAADAQLIGKAAA